jgi:hypothetical protein
VGRPVNRPTFERMKPRLVDVCRYISFEGLREALTAAHDYVSFLKPAWLQTISESCALETCSSPIDKMLSMRRQ